jgi:16S rRNA (guanine527-N7)-methyltransferase
MFNRYEEIFKAKNAHTNLMSKNDEKFIFEKHIFDSLAINLFFEKYNMELEGKRLLDIGTGGGFPLLPLSIVFDRLKLCGLDSTTKKIKIIDEIAKELGLKNVMTIADRAENLQKSHKKSFDLITSRAVGALDLILKYSLPLLKSDGYFIAYKSKRAEDEIKGAKNILRAHGAEIVDIIEYKLPLEEVYERNLIVVKQK